MLYFLSITFKNIKNIFFWILYYEYNIIGMFAPITFFTGCNMKNIKKSILLSRRQSVWYSMKSSQAELSLAKNNKAKPLGETSDIKDNEDKKDEDCKDQ